MIIYISRQRGGK